MSAMTLNTVVPMNHTEDHGFLIVSTILKLIILILFKVFKHRKVINLSFTGVYLCAVYILSNKV